MTGPLLVHLLGFAVGASALPASTVGSSSVALEPWAATGNSAVEAQNALDEETGLVRSVRREEAYSESLPSLVLGLPKHMTELAFTPLLPVVLVFEKYHLHERIFDLLTNDERTIALAPLIDVFNRSGLGLGAAFLRNDPLGSPDRTVLYALFRTNRDRAISLSYGRRLPFLSGRRLSLAARYEVDRDQRYFGLGPNTRLADERLLRSDSVDASLGLTLLDPAMGDWDARLEVAYRHRNLGTGTGDQPGVVAGADVPWAFGKTIDYPEATLSILYDSRDAAGRTTRGFVMSLETSATHDLGDSHSGGIRGTASFTAFLPVLPLNRVLVLSLGAAAAGPVGEGDEIPLHQMVNLGGSKTLRGYVSDRFVDRMGWWGTLEYRYKIYEYAGSGNGLSATFFTDVGRVGDSPRTLFDGPIAYSIGVGLRAEANLLLLGRFQIAYSPEGVRLTVGVGELL